MGSLSKRVFETLTATGSELFSLLTCLHTTKFILLSIFSPLEMISIRIWETWKAKCSLPVAVRVSKTRVLKLPNGMIVTEVLNSRKYTVCIRGLLGNPHIREMWCESSPPCYLFMFSKCCVCFIITWPIRHWAPFHCKSIGKIRWQSASQKRVCLNSLVAWLLYDGSAKFQGIHCMY